MDEEIEAFIDSALKAAAIVAVPASRPKRARRRRIIAKQEGLGRCRKFLPRLHTGKVFISTTRGHRTGVHTGVNSTPLEGPSTLHTCTMEYHGTKEQARTWANFHSYYTTCSALLLY